MTEVVVGIVALGGSVLMLKRIKSEGVLQWNFPGGKIESSEAVGDAVIREVAEETGLECTVSSFLGKRVHPDTGVVIHYVVCNVAGGILANMEPTKAEAAVWIPAGDIQGLVTSNLYPAVVEFLESLTQ